MVQWLVAERQDVQLTSNNVCERVYLLHDQNRREDDLDVWQQVAILAGSLAARLRQRHDGAWHRPGYARITASRQLP